MLSSWQKCQRQQRLHMKKLQQAKKDHPRIHMRAPFLKWILATVEMYLFFVQL
jgi:hypothetical protein